ncbi:MAG: MFS transporter [Ardenticatenaceae bacterium]|nr:MFS transporter [Ardenticatenaceae bacterium]
MPKQRHLHMVTAAVLLLIFVISLDARAVDTAMPTVVSQLGELSLFSWVFAAFTITSTTTVPLFGRLSDMYGRKPFVLVGIGFFLSGSLLCGQAQSMQQLVLFRGFQGIGAGALKPLTLTVLADIFPLEQRARLQTFVSGAFGAGPVLAPLVAGFLVLHVDWHWIFYLIVPPCLLAGLLLYWSMDEQWEPESALSIDYGGAFLLTAAIVLGLLGLLQTGKTHGWAGPQLLGLFGGSGLLLTGFLVMERRTPQPLVPLDIFRNRIVAAASISGFFTSMALWSTTAFVPLFIQGVLGHSAITAGASVAPLTLIWVVSSSIGGFVLLKRGYRVTAGLALAMVITGGYLLTQLGITSSYQQAILAISLVGFGGMALLAFLLSLQNAVGLRQRGIITGASEFSRGLGGAIGVSLTGSLLNRQLNGRVLALLPAAASKTDPANIARLASPQALLDPAVRAGLPEPTLHALQLALSGALTAAFLVPFIAAVCALVSSLWLPGGRAADHVVLAQEPVA